MTLPEREKLTDVSDRATEAEMGALEVALSEARHRARPQQAPLADGTFAVTECEDCGDDIGLERIKVAILNLCCVHCAARRERR